MKEIIYSANGDNEKFLLTDKEFSEARSAWNTKKNYFCPRIEASLSPYYLFARTPKSQVGYEVFVMGGEVLIFKKLDKYFRGYENTKVLINLTPEQTKKLIPIDEFYQSKKNYG